MADLDAPRLIMAALDTSAAIIRGGGELVPRYEAVTPKGRFAVFVQLPWSLQQRQAGFQILRDLLQARSTRALVASGELIEPDAVYAVYVDAETVMVAARVVRRGQPTELGPVEWLDPTMIGDEITQLIVADEQPPDARRYALDALTDGIEIDDGAALPSIMTDCSGVCQRSAGRHRSSPRRRRSIVPPLLTEADGPTRNRHR